MKSLRSVLAGAVVLAVLTATARADDAADLKAKLAAGMAGLTSLRIVMSTAAGTGTMTVLLPAGPTAPKRFAAKMVMNGPLVALQMYIVDGFMYQSINGSRFERRPLPDPAQAVHLGPGFDGSGQVTPLPDQVVDGTTYGAFTMSPGSGLIVSPLATLTCTYDKESGRIHRCGNDMMTMTYEGYDDPANAVELPAEAKDAVDLPPIPLRPPAVSPVPMGSP